MRNIARYGVPFVASFVILGAQAQGAPDDVAAIKKHFAQYVSLMNSIDTDTISTQTYNTPVFFAGADGKHSVIATPEQLSKSWRSLLSDREKNPSLPAMQYDVVSICLLSGDLATASVRYLSPQANSDSIKRSAWFYLLQKSNGEWHTTMLAAQSADVQVTCESKK